MPGYITGFAEQALVDSKNPKAKLLPIAKMMVHHFLYFRQAAWTRPRRLLERRRLHRRTRRGAPDRRPAAGHQSGVPRQVRIRNKTATGRPRRGASPPW